MTADPKNIWKQPDPARQQGRRAEDSGAVCVDTVERIVTSVSQAMASGFLAAMDASLADLRGAVDRMTAATQSLSQGVEALREGQSDRKVLFAEMQARQRNTEEDVRELKSDQKSIGDTLREATGTINKGIGASLVISVVLPLIVGAVLKLWK